MHRARGTGVRGGQRVVDVVEPRHLQLDRVEPSGVSSENETLSRPCSSISRAATFERRPRVAARGTAVVGLGGRYKRRGTRTASRSGRTISSRPHAGAPPRRAAGRRARKPRNRAVRRRSRRAAGRRRWRPGSTHAGGRGPSHASAAPPARARRSGRAGRGTGCPAKPPADDARGHLRQGGLVHLEQPQLGVARGHQRRGHAGDEVRPRAVVGQAQRGLENARNHRSGGGLAVGRGDDRRPLRQSCGEPVDRAWIQLPEQLSGSVVPPPLPARRESRPAPRASAISRASGARMTATLPRPEGSHPFEGTFGGLTLQGDVVRPPPSLGCARFSRRRAVPFVADLADMRPALRARKGDTEGEERRNS
jgi:hypothetical protein